MSLSSHLQVLREKHQHLSDEVEDAQRQPAFDDIQLSQMKKEKLRLKEEIEKLSTAH